MGMGTNIACQQVVLGRPVVAAPLAAAAAPGPAEDAGQDEEDQHERHQHEGRLERQVDEHRLGLADVGPDDQGQGALVVA